MSQIVAFNIALHSLTWTQWEPSVLVCMGDGPNTGVFKKLLPYLRDVTFMFPPVSETENIPFYYAQIDGLFRWAPRDADALVRMDADTLLVGDLEDLLDYVVDRNAIAGVMAHFAFPPLPRVDAREGWRRVAEGLITRRLEFRYSYSLTDASAPPENHYAPFYVNDGAVFLAKAVFDEFAQRFLQLRRAVITRLGVPYFAGQVALTLAVTDIGARTCALPMRYNFPNDESATKKFPEELEAVKIFHYLRTDQFDRQRIFASSDEYHRFLGAPLRGANKVFQETVRRIIGVELPYCAPGDHSGVAIASAFSGNQG